MIHFSEVSLRMSEEASVAVAVTWGAAGNDDIAFTNRYVPFDLQKRSPPDVPLAGMCQRGAAGRANEKLRTIWVEFVTKGKNIPVDISLKAHTGVLTLPSAEAGRRLKNALVSLNARPMTFRSL